MSCPQKSDFDLSRNGSDGEEHPARPASSLHAIMLACVVAMAGAGLPSMAQAQSGREAMSASRQLSLPAQPLGQTLNMLARTWGVSISVDSALVEGRTAPAQQGASTLGEALQKALAGTGLVAVPTGASVTVQRAPAPTSERVRPAPAAGQVDSLEEVRVTEAAMPSVYSEGKRSYTPQSVEVGKAAQSLREIPQSVTVVTRQRMDDQAMRTLDEVMNYTTGVTREENWLDTTYQSRGLNITNFRYDGSATTSVRSGARSQDMAQFDSVALLRGPDGLFGAGEAGGVINFTYKRPQAERKTKVLVSAGTMNNYRAELDTTGALNESGSLRGRAVVVTHNRDDMAEPSRQKRRLLYGTVEMDLAPETVVTLGASYQNDKNPGFNSSLPRYADGSDIGFARDTNMGAPWNWLNRENTTLFAKLDHQLAAGWKLKAQVRHTRFNEGINAAEIENAPSPTTGSGADWWINQVKTKSRETGVDVNVQGGFDALGQRHDVILGFDTQHSNDYSRSLWPRIGSADVFNRTPPADPGYPMADWAYGSQTVTQRSGLYGSLRMRPVENVAVVLGGRYTLQERSTQHDKSGTLNSKVVEGNVFVPYAGVIWDVSRDFSVYASTAEIFKSQADKLSAPLPGTPLDPVRGRTYELGVKGELAQGLAGSAAIFRTEKKGAAAMDPAYPSTEWRGGCCWFRDGYQLSQGIDLELTGQVAPDLQVAMGYTFNDNVDKRAGDERFATITPRHLFKAWGNYRFSGDLRGWSAGAGVTMQSGTFRKSGINAYNPDSGQYDGAWTAYQFNAPGHAIWSARVGYEINKDWSVAMNISNLFDKTYYSTVGYAGYGNFYGEKRAVVFTLQGNF
ncbi:TonB-dependent receptor [Diaphorobacter sp. HDW4B]|uniref:TonB-dependent siderophore receptor n=1 Tax=Diaphorobacter sp. HDW4B TaxID=2714925 RepID=UPI001F0D6C31|nr:TonB-dependent receptor [Diaphorobacter sp. HDW4B]